jgi:divalent metal cation (Fe/Co/Zn/Cd) transporter
MSHKQLLPFLAPGGMAAAKVAAETIPVPGAIALVMAGISIASKEWLYRITKEVGEKLNSVRVSYSSSVVMG